MFRRLGQFFLDIIQIVVFAIAIFLFVYLLILQPHKIKGASMSPNYLNGEYLLTDKVTYRFQQPERGDIIVFEAPTNDGQEFIKRIIALPREEISVKNGSIFVNGKKLEEDYIAHEIETAPGAFLEEGEAVVVPEDQFFVLGDNRGHSSDSRAWGFVEKDKITGRAWVIYWPLDKAGTVKSPNYNL
jgi:signal peptidase I